MVVAAIIALLGGGAFTAGYLLKDELAPVSIGSRAPEFSALTLDGASTVKSIRNYKGDVVVLNIWATWCGPCREEMPSIQKLYSALGPKGLKVVAVSVDPAGKEQTVRDFAKEFGLTFEVLHDSTGVIQEIYRATGVPQTFVIGRDGLIRKKWIGGEDWNSEPNRRLLESLLSEPRG
jgi:peroxiredoxin